MQKTLQRALKKKIGKTSRLDSKASKSKAADELIDVLEEATPGSKLRKPGSKREDQAEEKKDDDYFGGWGSMATSKKTAGKKDSASKKEIGIKEWSNQDDALADFSHDPDAGIDFDKPTSSSKTAKAMPSAAKSKGNSSVAERIKALENKKEEGGKKSKGDPWLTKDLPPTDDAPSPKEETKLIGKASGPKTKTSPTLKTSKTSKKDALPVTEEKKSKDSVPGSFPGAFDNEFDDNYDDDQPFKSPEKPKAKAKAVDKKTTKSKTTTPKQSAQGKLDLLDEDPAPSKGSSPPPEDKKTAKKERPRVERSATTSWGFWGAAPPPKKPTKEKSKDEEEMPPPPPPFKKEKPPTGLTRSKSTRTSKEKEIEDRRDVEKLSKSSGSDKDTITKKAEKPKAVRGTSFSNFMFGGPPPSAMPRSKTTATRRPSSVASSRPSSRRQSMDGFTSPVADDEPQFTDKAAKLMGLKGSKAERRPSIKKKAAGKLKIATRPAMAIINPSLSTVSDPYPIDDDDMVMIHINDNPPLVNGDSRKEKAKVKSAKTKKEVGA